MLENEIEKTLIKEIPVEKYGYIIKIEDWKVSPEPKTQKIRVRLGYTLEGNYIGDIETTKFLCEEKGIKPELKRPDCNICSIGYSSKDNKWYGWSHRAICGFKVGDIVKKGDATTDPGWTEEYLKEHPEDDRSLPVGFKAKDLEDCKRMAIAFSDAVS